MLKQRVQIITIPISSVAALIGLDHYNNFAKIVCNLWQKMDRTEFSILESDLRRKGIKLASDTEHYRATQLDKTHGTNITQAISSITATKQTSGQMCEQRDALIKTISERTDIPACDRDDIIKQITSATNKMHGVRNESDILGEFARQRGVKIAGTQADVKIFLPHATTLQQPPMAKLPRSLLNSSPTPPEVNPIQWMLSGKCDAVTDTGEIIEAKKRVKGLFHTLRDYENVQIQLYLAGRQCACAHLIESYSTGGEAKELEVNIIDIARDDNYINNLIYPRLGAFTRFFMDFMNNDEWKQCVIRGDQERKIYGIYEGYMSSATSATSATL